MGKVYNNIVVSNDSNEEDSLVASSAQSRQGDGGCQGGNLGRGGRGCSSGRGKSGAGGPSNLGKDIVVTTNGPKAKIIVRKSKGSQKSVGTGSACSSCCDSTHHHTPPKVVYVPFCPHQMAASFPVPIYEPYPQQPPSHPQHMNYDEQLTQARQSIYQSQSRPLSSPRNHQSYEEPMIASSAQLLPQYHTTLQLPLPHHSLRVSSSPHSSMPFAHHSPLPPPPPPVSFHYTGMYHPIDIRTSTESIRHSSPNLSSLPSSQVSPALMRSLPVNSNIPQYSYSQSHSSPPSLESSRLNNYSKHSYPTSNTSPRENDGYDTSDEFEFGRRTSPAHSDEGPDDQSVASSNADPFAAFIAKHGHPKLPR